MSERVNCKRAMLIVCYSLVMVGCRSIVLDSEKDAASEIIRIIPGEPFNETSLKLCKVVAKGRISGLDISDNSPLWNVWSRGALKKKTGVKIKGNMITEKEAALILYELLLKDDSYSSYVDISDGTFNADDLVGGVVYLVHVTDKPPGGKSWWYTYSEGPHYVFIIVSKTGIVLCRHDIERVPYVVFDFDYIDNIAKTGVYYPWGVIESRRSYMECIYGRDAFDMVGKLQPRTPTQMRLDAGYPVPPRY